MDRDLEIFEIPLTWEDYIFEIEGNFHQWLQPIFRERNFISNEKGIDLQENIKIIFRANELNSSKISIREAEERRMHVYISKESLVNYSRYSISKHSNWILTYRYGGEGMIYNEVAR